MVRNPIFIGFTRVKGLDTILGKLSALFNGGLLLVNINRMSVFYTQKRAVVTAYLNRKGSPSLFEEDKGGNSAKLLGKTMTEADKMVKNCACGTKDTFLQLCNQPKATKLRQFLKATS